MQGITFTKKGYKMKILTKILTLLLILSMLLSAVSCDDKTGNDDTDKDDGTTQSEKTTYTVKVLSPVGTPLSDVLVYVHKGDADFGLVGMGVRTNKAGEASFLLESAEDYSVQLDDLPEKYIAKSGLTRADRYDMGTNVVTVSVEFNPEYNPAVYTLGDKIADFTLTDIGGTEYSLYDLLKTKDMVMLNFWFVGCPPCAAEFPAINSAYKTFKKDIEILAINDYPSDTSSSVGSYSENKGFGLEMPLFKVSRDSSPIHINRFENGGYPTTVIIDRNGVICFVHSGAVPSEELWSNAFAYFTAENYTTTLFKSITEIPTV